MIAVRKTVSRCRFSWAVGLFALAALVIPRWEVSAQTLAQIVEGAKKEGTLRGQWSQASFGGSAGVAELVAGMNKKYGVQIKSQFTPGPDMQRMMLRVVQEAAAGQAASTDVYLGNSQAILDAMQANVMLPMDWDKMLERKLPSEGSFDPIAPGKIAIAFASTMVGVLYNAELVKGDDIPRRLNDLLNPKWKGKIASTPYAAGLREFATPDFLGREYMIEFTKKYSKQIAGLMRCGEDDRIVSGEFLMLGLTCGGNDAIVARRKGAPIDHALLDEGTVVHTRYAGVPKNSRSPNAAALLIAYILTPEGQSLLWKYDGMDLHLLPESNAKKDIEKVRAAGGKIVVSSPQWLGSVKGYSETQKTLEKILREGR